MTRRSSIAPQQTGRLTLERRPTVDQLREEIARADAVYTDTWVNMELINDPAAKPERERLERAMRPFQLNPTVYGTSTAKIMHCMPVHLGYEITRELVDHPNSVIYPQAENRMHAARAILAQLLDTNARG
jgi:ornithine carbamoyltransferase